MDLNIGEAQSQTDSPCGRHHQTCNEHTAANPSSDDGREPRHRLREASLALRITLEVAANQCVAASALDDFPDGDERNNRHQAAWIHAQHGDARDKA